MNSCFPWLRLSTWCSGALLGVISACSGSNSSATPILASSTIGPEGGVVVVTSGAQQGLVLTVPAGAVDRPTAFIVRDQSILLPPELRTLQYAPVAGIPFRIEPANLVLNARATLRMPYQPGGLSETAPGNVVAHQESPYATWDHVPEVINAVEAWFEFGILTLGRFQAVPGPRVERLLDYVPPVGSVATLEDGYTFRVEDVDPASPFAGQGAVQWRILGPGVDDRLIFVGEELIARESAVENWRETWSLPYSPWLSALEALGNGVTGLVQVQPLPAGPGASFTGQVTVFGYRQFDLPRSFGQLLLLDVLKLNLELAWNRPDIGVGQRHYIFRFSPDVGLLEFSQDGLVRQRLPD